MITVKTFCKQNKYKLPLEILSVISKYGFVFNPSFISINNKNYISFRLCENKKSSIKAYVFYWETGRESNFTKINLSEFFRKEIALKKVADPKMFFSDDIAYITFNTGQPKSVNNQIYIVSLEKGIIINYWECYKDQRLRVEKNWAFFKKNNKWYCLYNINPLIILEESKVTEESSKIFFESIIEAKTKYIDYSIGTPLTTVDNETFYFIGHKKKYFKRKRLYYGSMFKLRIDLNRAECDLSKENDVYIDSFKSLLGNRFKFNRRLISCTYFSGIYLKNKQFVIGYGINDISWNLVKIPFQKLIKS